MAKQSTVWLSDKGEVCRTEKDANLADAGDAITAFLERNVLHRGSDRDDIYQLLTQHATELRNLLTTYEDAAYQRREEVSGE